MKKKNLTLYVPAEIAARIKPAKAMARLIRAAEKYGSEAFHNQKEASEFLMSIGWPVSRQTRGKNDLILCNEGKDYKFDQTDTLFSIQLAIIRRNLQNDPEWPLVVNLLVGPEAKLPSSTWCGNGSFLNPFHPALFELQEQLANRHSRKVWFTQARRSLDGPKANPMEPVLRLAAKTADKWQSKHDLAMLLAGILYQHHHEGFISFDNFLRSKTYVPGSGRIQLPFSGYTADFNPQPLPYIPIQPQSALLTDADLPDFSPKTSFLLKTKKSSVPQGTPSVQKPTSQQVEPPALDRARSQTKEVMLEGTLTPAAYDRSQIVSRPSSPSNKEKPRPLAEIPVTPVPIHTANDRAIAAEERDRLRKRRAKFHTAPGDGDDDQGGPGDDSQSPGDASPMIR